MSRVRAYEFTGSGWQVTHPDLTVDNVTWRTSLNSPTVATISVENERPGLPRFVPWSTAFGVEVSGSLQAFVVLSQVDTDDQKMTLGTVGLTGYPDGMPWTDAAVRKYEADPGHLIVDIWDKLQSHRWGNLGVQVNRVDTKVRVGRKVAEKKDSEGKILEAAVDEPWVVDRTETHDLGAEIDQLVSEAGLEWREEVSYGSGSSPVVRMTLGSRQGRRREDLYCEIGVTVAVVPSTAMASEDYASDVLLIGAGEGPSRVVSHRWVSTPSRIRRVYTHQAQDIYRQPAADSEAAKILSFLQPKQGNIRELIVRDHPAMPVWTIAPGDELRLRGNLGQEGTIDRWVRVISIESDLSAIQTRRLEVENV